MKIVQAYVLVFSLVPFPCFAAAGISNTDRQLSVARVFQQLAEDFLFSTFDVTEDGGEASQIEQSSEQILQKEEYQPGALLLFQQHHDHRQLQLTGTCNTSYTEFFEQNPELRNASTYYLYNYGLALESSLSGNVCAVDDNGDVVCDLDVPIDGETEFRSACTTAGGRVLSLSLDMTCSMTLVGGGTFNSITDLSSRLDCIPSSTTFDDNCVEIYSAGLNNIVADGIAGLESSSETGGSFTDVTCSSLGGNNNVVIEDNGGSSTSGPTEEDGMVESDAGASDAQGDEEVDNGGSTTGDEAVGNGGTSSGRASTQGFLVSGVLLVIWFLFVY